MRRRAAVLVLLVAVGVGACASPDGRFHTCGLVTDRGVTEYLDAYAARCGEQHP